MATHQDQPVFHLYDPNGWVNDPNGPLYYKGKYHMFFQNVADSNKWTWGLGWGHATSTDLLHWQQQPVALLPEPGWYDADGCFSGCATVDTDGIPAILYTGVAKKPDAGEREGMPLTVNKLCNETQLIARPADPDDPDLKVWVKSREPFISDHMSGLPLNCFRDPFILEKPCEGNEWRWRIMVGSNIEIPLSADEAGGEGQVTTLGTATVYRSKTKDLEGDWGYDGLLCVAKPGEGAIWECPILVPLKHTDGKARPDSTAAAAAAAAIKDAGTPDGSPNITPPAPPSTPEDMAAAAAAPCRTPAVTAAAGSKVSLKGAVAAIASETQQELARQQQQQQQEDLERAMSGCLGLWHASEGGKVSPRNSLDGGSSAAVSSGSNAQLSLSPGQGYSSGDPPPYLFSVSAGVCPAIYWLGRYVDGRFDLDAADGPHALDLGDVLYAPNLLEDAQGRQIIWGWLQEHPSPLSHDYAGCISTPRQLTLGVKHHKRHTPTSNSSSSSKGGMRKSSSSSSLNNITGAGGALGQQDEGHAIAAAGSSVDVEYYLVQKPLPELDQLRSGRGMRLRGIQLPSGKPWSVPSQVSASHLDLTLTVRPTPGAKRFQVLLGPLRQEGEQQQQHQQHQHQQQENRTLAAAVGAGNLSGSSAADAAAQAAALDAAAQGSDAAGIAAAAAAAATRVLLNAQPLIPGAVASSGFVPVMGSVTPGALGGPPAAATSPVAAAEAAALAAAAEAATSPRSAAVSDDVPSLPHSPSGAAAPAVVPLLPVNPGELAAVAAAAASLPSADGGGNSNIMAYSALPLVSPFLDTQTHPAAAGSSLGLAGGAGGSQSRNSFAGSDGVTTEYSESAAAAAAAAAIEQVAEEHHQAAAIIYEFSTAQLQVLVGPPAAVLKLLKQQQEDLAAATAAGSGSTSPVAPAADGTMASRTAVPTSDTLGFEPPTLPPAPTGSLTDFSFMAAAQAAGVRVLACQLRELDPREPFELRLLLDYSIVEMFLSTGEALTTRVYRGVPTARAKEASMRKAAAHAATEAAEAADAAASDQMSASGSLANLGLLLQQQLVRSGSGRLLSAAATPRAGVPTAAGAGLGSNLLSPSNPIGAAFFNSTSGIQGFDSPADSPKIGISSTQGGLSLPGPALTKSGQALGPSGLVSTVRSGHATGVESPESLSGLGGLGSPTYSSQSTGSLGHLAANHPRRLSAPASLHLPFSPRTYVYGSYVQYFSPARNLSARVGWRNHAAAGGLPTLAGILEDQAAAAAAAAGPEDLAGSSSRDEVGAAVAQLLGKGAAGGRSDRAGAASVQEPAAAVSTADEAAPAADGKEFGADIATVVTDPAAAAAAAFAAAAEAAAAEAADSSNSSSKRAPVAAPSRLVIPDIEPTSPERTAPKPEESAGSFPGFSPHRPLMSAEMLGGGLELGPAGAGAAARGSSSAGEKLTSWFQKMTRKSSKKDDKVDGTSSSSKVVVPASFGHPLPPPFAPLPPAPTVVAADGAESSDVSASSDRDQSSSAAAHKAAAAVTKPGLQIRTSSTKTKPPNTVTSTAAAAPTPAEEHRRGIALPPAAPAVVAVDSPDTAAARGGTSGHTASHIGSTYSTIRHLTASRPATTSEGSGSQPGSAKSPRRNWRSAFVFSDSDDELETSGPADQGLGGLTGTGGAWGSADHAALLGQAVSGPGLPQPGVIRTTPFGVLHTDPQVAEFGMYAKVLAPGVGAAAASAAGPGIGVGTFGIGGVPTAGKIPVKVLGGAAVAAGGIKASGYVPGAMREVSLVALGGGGVVLRLEAHEINSMWDEE